MTSSRMRCDPVDGGGGGGCDRTCWWLASHLVNRELGRLCQVTYVYGMLFLTPPFTELPSAETDQAILNVSAHPLSTLFVGGKTLISSGFSIGSVLEKSRR